ncbi:hypothetical protein EDEG_02575 [Edhazardia aedis USNM 41457]|uniref:Histidine kinase/HSP90-like ATPase domain-containing protein n=1 Tax=Edhazardia aedis (strain USNM 41457) TaxID=1003232 RepID=J8ZTS1_EDHAE|nr:hypothetical protein EDEG_02575 [Edhazardia aedis USNM 41457]|eukprot:EJW03043.1 hypothetical protein EDEG_02575 [Edhazardia aedis USNM 41457]
MAEDKSFKYDVEISSLMSTIVNALYSDKSLAFRELISNASDACDKYQLSYYLLLDQLNTFREKKGLDNAELPAIHDENVILSQPSELRITVESKDGTLTFEDNGIGMTKEDLKNFLGVVSRSGTKKFKETMKSFDSMKKLIGQFGLGFYSSFLLADHVKVISKHPFSECFTFESKGLDEFSVYETPDCEKIKDHGTKVVLFVREGDENYKGQEKVEEIVKKYSMFIPYPIYIIKENVEEVEEEKSDNQNEEEKVDGKEENLDAEKIAEEIVNSEIEQNENNKDNEVPMENIAEDSEKEAMEPLVEKKSVKKVTKTTKVPTLINKEKPLWLIQPKNVTKEQYTSFYKTISNDWDDYLAVKHVTLEGQISLTFLLFIPKRNRNSFFEKQEQKPKNVKLYVSNVFVTDDLKDAIPEYFNFVHGIISSDDIPMNVSREICQGNNTIRMIKNNFPKKIVEMFEELKNTPEYDTLYKEFGPNIKIAAREATGNLQDKLASLLQFYTSKSKDKMVTLDDYLTRNKVIYYCSGLNKDEVYNSPYLNLFADDEVLFMYEPVDQILLQGFTKYKDVELKNIASQSVLQEKGKIDNDITTKYQAFLDAYKKELDEFVEQITLKDLKDIPCLVTTSQYGYSAALESMLKSQPGIENNPLASFMFKSKKNFEINPNHKIIQNLMDMYEKNDMYWKDVGLLVYQNSLISCGYKMDDGVSYSKLCFNVLNLFLDRNNKKSINSDSSESDRNVDEKNDNEANEKDNIVDKKDEVNVDEVL